MNSTIARLTLSLCFFIGTLGFTLARAQVSDPTVALASGPSNSPQTALVTVSDTTSGAVIYYTTDGTSPTTSSATVANGGTVLVGQNATLSVQAYSGATASNVVTSSFGNAGMVSSGSRHTLILKSNGTVWASGNNTYGELGNGDTSGAAQSYPVQVMVSSGTPLTGIISVSAGTDESFAVDSSGNVWAWGYNPDGELGLGTSNNTFYATELTSFLSAYGYSVPIVSISSNGYHTLAVQSNGSVWAWGADSYGQAGVGFVSSTVLTYPYQVVGVGGTGNLGGIIAVATGINHSVALDKNGNVWSWGANGSGQLGNGDSTLAAQSSPVAVLKNETQLTNALQIAANATDSYAFRNDGTVYSWGDNSTGELGNGTTTSTSSAVQVSGLTGYMAGIASGAAVDPNGLAWTWGANNNGQLGIGYTGYYSTLPLQVNPLSTSSPTLTTTAGNGQTVIDGSSSSPFTISSSNGEGTWVNLVINPADGELSTSSGASELSPIIGGATGASGSINFYLVGASTGSVTLTATSGSSQSILSAIEQIQSTDTPTMPEWMLIMLGLFLFYAAFAKRRRIMLS